VTDAELKRSRGGVRGVRFNFVKRLVDFTPMDELKEIAERYRARLAHRRHFEAADF
jgi:2-pyrone-4,6-dicarboxylate lactonase